MLRLRLIVNGAITFSLIMKTKTFHFSDCELSSEHTGIECISISKETTKESLRIYIYVYLGLNILFRRDANSVAYSLLSVANQ